MMSLALTEHVTFIIIIVIGIVHVANSWEIEKTSFILMLLFLRDTMCAHFPPVNGMSWYTSLHVNI